MVGVSAQQWRYENETFVGIELVYRFYLYNECFCRKPRFVIYRLHIKQSLYGFHFCPCDL